LDSENVCSWELLLEMGSYNAADELQKARNKQRERDDEQAYAQESNASVNKGSRISEIVEQAQITLWAGAITYRKTHDAEAAQRNAPYEKPSLERHHIERKMRESPNDQKLSDRRQAVRWSDLLGDVGFSAILVRS
jgi:hypothetical protein